MKRVVILTVSILAIGFLSTAFNPVPKAGTDLSNNVEALLERN
jgi:predicted small secreted protein